MATYVGVFPGPNSVVVAVVAVVVVGDPLMLTDRSPLLTL